MKNFLLGVATVIEFRTDSTSEKLNSGRNRLEHASQKGRENKNEGNN